MPCLVVGGRETAVNLACGLLRFCEGRPAIQNNNLLLVLQRGEVLVLQSRGQRPDLPADLRWAAQRKGILSGNLKEEQG